MNKSRIVLEFIGSHGEHGVRYTDIQKFICKIPPIKNWDEYSHSEGVYNKDLNKWEYPPRVIGPKPGYRRHNRGIWGTNLTNILGAWCVRNAEGRWVLHEWPGERAVYRQWETEASKVNKAYDLARNEAYKAKLPICPSCGSRVWNHKHCRVWKASKGTACNTMGAGGFSVDCNDMVWVDESDKLFFLTKLVRAEGNEIYEKSRYRDFTTYANQRAWVVNQILLLNASKQ